MGFAEDFAKLVEQVRKRADQVVGEEATKMALILPDTVGEFMKTATLGRNSYGRSRVYRGSKQFANRINYYTKAKWSNFGLTL